MRKILLGALATEGDLRKVARSLQNKAREDDPPHRGSGKVLFIASVYIALTKRKVLELLGDL